MASIHRRQGGAKYIRWRCPISGRNRQYTPQDQRATWIARLCRDIERACDSGIAWVPPTERASERPDLAEMIAADLADRSRSKTSGYIANLEIVFGLFLDSLAAHHPQERLTGEHLSRQALSDYYDYLVHVRGSCAPGTAASRIRLVQGLWRRLHEHDVYGDHVPRPRSLPDLPEAQSIQLPAPTWEEMDRATAHAYGWYAILLLILRFTGLRKGQAMRLQWDDIDLTANMLRIRPELGKTRSERQGRVIPVSPYLGEELAGLGRREGFIIDTAGANRVAKTEMVMAAWSRAGVREQVWAGIADKRRAQPCHAMRHGFITGLLAGGAKRELVQVLVGHKGDITSRYTDHTHLLPQLREVVALVPPLHDVAVTLRNSGRGFPEDARFAPRSRTRTQSVKKVLTIK